MANLDQLFLSGAIFNDSRSSSPTRSASPDNDLWGSENEEAYDSDAERNKEIEKMLGKSNTPSQSIGMGPGRTGVKGVIRDRAEARQLEREKREREVAELNARMEKANLGGKTFLEEEQERELEKIMLEGATAVSSRNNSAASTGVGMAKFGHLREVNIQNYLALIEEDPSIWVVLHIYDPSLDRCYDLNATLVQLARLHPTTKFLRGRASVLGFASISNSRKKRLRTSNRRKYHDDEAEESYSDEQESNNDPEEDDDVDLDVLPTMLVYKGGELVHNWIRVDWEAGRDTIEELLSKHHIIHGGRYSFEEADRDLLDSES